MEIQKNPIIALSLAVIALSSVVVLQSISHSRVLGDSTSNKTTSASPLPAKMMVDPKPICPDITELYSNYCINKATLQANRAKQEYATNEVSPPELVESDPNGTLSGTTTDLKVIAAKKGFCGDLYKLVNHFCPGDTSTGTKPTPICKSGLNSFTPGEACKGTPASTSISSEGSTGMVYTSATYSCHDGKTGIVNTPKGGCVSIEYFQQEARKACEGHSLCKATTTQLENPKLGGKLRHCTGDKDCKDNEICQLPAPPTQASGAQPEIAMFGKCVSANSGSSDPSGAQVGPKVTGSSKLPSCAWCGTNCVPYRIGLKCPSIGIPTNRSCVSTGQGCTVVTTSTTQ